MRGGGREQERPLTKQLSMEQETRPGRVIAASRGDGVARGAGVASLSSAPFGAKDSGADGCLEAQPPEES